MKRDAWMEDAERDLDDLGAARGMVYGIAMGVGLWVVGSLVWLLVVRFA